jgi:hypothetical protein
VAPEGSNSQRLVFATRREGIEIILLTVDDLLSKPQSWTVDKNLYLTRLVLWVCGNETRGPDRQLAGRPEGQD